jgi:diguanylate cyclase (GGDEF)-like protein
MPKAKHRDSMNQLFTSRYERKALLGEGGMGRVYLAYDTLQAREVALKEILTIQGDSLDGLKQEFWWMTRLAHPGLLEVYDFGIDEAGHPFFTMEVVGGARLDASLPLTQPQTREVLKQLLGALGAIHRQGLVHGDIKPENIRLLPSGLIKLMDFGLMARAGASASPKGTLAYMAPEILNGERIDARADLYALGITAYQLLTGRLPFEASTATGWIKAHGEEAPRPPSLLIPELKGEWDSVVLKLLAKEPQKRFSSVGEVLEALGEAIDNQEGLLLTSPFIGRERELGLLNLALERCLVERQGAVFHLTGSVGLGKSRLLDEVAFKAQLAGLPVWRSQAQSAGGIPYEPFIQLLRQAWSDISQAAGALLEIHGPALHVLVPNLAPSGASHRLEPQQEKLRLQNALVAIFTAVARERGLVIMLDNWQDADPLSLDLWAVLTRQLAGEPAVMILASREAAETETGRLPLEPFTRAETSAMLEAMLGTNPIPEAFLTQMIELSGAAPYAIEALLTHVQSQQLLTISQGRFVLKPLPAGALPADAGALFLARVEKLTPDALRILELSAVLGRGFGVALLSRMLPELSLQELYEPLAALENAQFLSHQAGIYTLAQTYLGEAMLHRLAWSTLRALHTQVAEALEESVGESEDEGALVGRLAYHFLAGDRPAKAVMYALSAAQRTAALYANEQAHTLLIRGWSLLEVQSEAPDALKVDYLSLLGDLSRIQGAFHEAETYYNQALPLALGMERADAQAHVLVGLGILRQIASDYEGALEFLKQALPHCRRGGNAREELRCLTCMGRVHYYAGHLASSQSSYEEALSRARAVGDLAHAGEALGFLGVLFVSAEPVAGKVSTVSSGLEYLRQAIEIKERIGDRIGLNDSLMLLGNAQLLLGDLPGAEVSFKRNQAICQEVGAQDDETFSHLNLGVVAFERGECALALVRLDAAIEMATPKDNQLAIGLAECMKARALLHMGHLAMALPMLEASLKTARELESPYWELFALVALMASQLKLGMGENAGQTLLEALSLQASSGILEFSLTLQLGKAQLALRQANDEAAESAFRETLAHAELKEAQISETQACLGMAELSLKAGALPESIRWATRAQDRALATGASELQLEGQLILGRIAEALGEVIEADSHYVRAQENAERLQLTELSARALHRRAVLQFPSPHAGDLLRQAQDLLTQAVKGLPGDVQAAYLADAERMAIFLGEVFGPTDAQAAPVNDERLLKAQEMLESQRQWIDELQSSTGLLRKQLNFSQAIIRGQEAPRVMQQALTLLLEMTQLERAELLIVEGKGLQLRASKELTSLSAIQEDWTLHQGILNQAMETGQAVYDQEAGLIRLALPLKEDGGASGAVLLLGLDQEGLRLGKRELDALRTMASQLAAALKNLRLQTEWQEKSQRLEMLYMLSSSVTSTLVMEEVLDLVLKLSLNITRSERGFLLLLNSQEQLECRSARHAHGPIAHLNQEEAYSQSICRRVLETGEALCVEDIRDDELLKNQKSIQSLDLRSVMCVPLKIKQKVLGVLYVDSRVVVNAFTERDLDLLRSIASHASIALENARLYHLATVDGLTQLYFRSHFEQRLREEMARAQRYGSPLSLMMVDIDHFKKFNDTYGHAVGDAVLRHVAGLVKDTVRQDIDIPARYGGEEIIVLLPETDVEGASIIAERVRKAIDEALVSTEGHANLHVSVSVGVATMPTHADSATQLMEFADQALYASKRNGRNLMTVYSPSPELA